MYFEHGRQTHRYGRPTCIARNVRRTDLYGIAPLCAIPLGLWDAVRAPKVVDKPRYRTIREHAIAVGLEHFVRWLWVAHTGGCVDNQNLKFEANLL